MKTIFTAIAIVLSVSGTYAQIPTNIFPATGDVGIGTTTPAAPLHVTKALQNLQFGTGPVPVDIC